MIENKELIERFLRYCKIDTQSDEDIDAQPSTEKQHKLAKLLCNELCEMGVEADYDKEHCYVYAVLKGEEPALGFVSHMDTSPAASGFDVKPRIEENYRGGAIILNAEKGIELKSDDFPELNNHIGEDIIVTDGTTLLGADDKAGIAEIMNLLYYYTSHPKKKHRTICVAFTPDEEVGRGAENFNIKKFATKEAYTVDGGKLGEIEYECFNAAGAKVCIEGRSVHPGSAKNLMINAQNIAFEFHSMLPFCERPEHTEGYEGFYHLDTMSGDVEKAVLKYIIRDHNRSRFEERKNTFINITEYINGKYRAFAGGKDILTLTLNDQYYNMADLMGEHMNLVDEAVKAYEDGRYSEHQAYQRRHRRRRTDIYGNSLP